MSEFGEARYLIRQFKGEDYAFGAGALARSGEMAAQLGRRAVLFAAGHAGAGELIGGVKDSLRSSGVAVIGELAGAGTNAPRDDVWRMADWLTGQPGDLVVAVGGGSNIDAAKAAGILATLGGPVERYFGTGLVTEALAARGRDLRPLLAVQTASSSAAHLTKYANITDRVTAQKKLIVDGAIVPPRAVFQYDVTTSMSPAFTADGALDGMSHLIEVLYGAVGQPFYDQAEEIAGVGVRLLVRYLERAIAGPGGLEAREALGLATDLGGYAIMIGGTNGGHLTSFSLVDILSHGRACAITNPYYTVFFAPAIERPLRLLAGIFREAGLIRAGVESLSGRELGEAVAGAMIALWQRIGFPTTLAQVPGFTDQHIARALAAAKDPQLKMKLQNMPVPLTADMVEEYMAPVLYAARDGDLGRIKNVA